MNKQLLKAANEAWLRGYDVKVVFSMHDKQIKISFGKKKAITFTSFSKALSFFNAGLQFAEPDKLVGTQRREAVGAEEIVESEEVYEPVE